MACITGQALVVWLVDGDDNKRITLSRCRSDPSEVELVSRRNIVLLLGSPLTQIQPFRDGSE